MISIYAGGVAAAAPRPGGWAAIVVDERGEPASFAGQERSGDALRCQLKAAIEGLLRTPPGCQAVLFTESTRLIESAPAPRAADVNRDLWDVLQRLLARRSVVWQWPSSPGDRSWQAEAVKLARHAVPGMTEPAPGPPGLALAPIPQATPATGESGQGSGLSRGSQAADDLEETPAWLQDAVARSQLPEAAGPPSEAPIPQAAPAPQPEAPAEAVQPGAEGAGADAPGHPRLTHLDEQGAATMVDISAKGDTDRIAVARGRVIMKRETLDLIRQGQAAKGDVLGAARIAGIMGAKQTAHLIPLCHPLLLTKIDVDLRFDEADGAVEIAASAMTTGKTGVEMEALTAVAIAALTIYDMCKAVDRAMRIEGIRLVRKSGGKSGEIVLE